MLRRVRGAVVPALAGIPRHSADRLVMAPVRYCSEATA